MKTKTTQRPVWRLKLMKVTSYSLEQETSFILMANESFTFESTLTHEAISTDNRTCIQLYK